jgi:hypothetical protein
MACGRVFQFIKQLIWWLLAEVAQALEIERAAVGLAVF